MITFPSPLAHYYTNINGEDRQIEAFIIMVWVDLTNYGDILVGGSLPNSILEEDIMVSFRISISDYILIEEESDEKYQLLFLNNLINQHDHRFLLSYGLKDHRFVLPFS